MTLILLLSLLLGFVVILFCFIDQLQVVQKKTPLALKTFLPFSIGPVGSAGVLISNNEGGMAVANGTCNGVATTIGIVSSDQEAMGTMSCVIVSDSFLENLGVVVQMTNSSDIQGTFLASIYLQRKDSFVFENTSLQVDQVLQPSQTGIFYLSNSFENVFVSPGDRITLWVRTAEPLVIFTVKQLSGGLELIRQ